MAIALVTRNSNSTSAIRPNASPSPLHRRSPAAPLGLIKQTTCHYQHHAPLSPVGFLLARIVG
ncbi:MAG: hypothetical protein ACKO4L_06650 [Nodosilinea sp.]